MKKVESKQKSVVLSEVKITVKPDKREVRIPDGPRLKEEIKEVTAMNVTHWNSYLVLIKNLFFILLFLCGYYTLKTLFTYE